MVDSEVASKDRLPPSPKHEKVQLKIQLARLCKLHPQSNQPNSFRSNLREHCPSDNLATQLQKKYITYAKDYKNWKVVKEAR
jgi:hypothetical protein